MEPSLLVPLGEQEHLGEFFDMLRDGGRNEQAEDVEQLLSCIKGMQEELSDALDEVRFLREQIKMMQDKTMKVKLQKMQAEVQGSMEQAWEQMGKVKKEVSGQISNAIAACKKKGIQGTSHILDAAHVYEGLSRAELYLNKSVAAMAKRIEKADRMAEELHGIKGHMKNIGNVAAGKPLDILPERDHSKGLFAKIERSMEYCKKLLAGMGKKMLAAKAHMVHLQQITERKGEERIASVQEIMEELRASSNLVFAAQDRAPESR